MQRVSQDPFNLIATLIFAFAILHVFGAARFTALAHRVQHAHDERLTKAGMPSRPRTLAEFLHFLGEVEVIFGLGAVVLGMAITAYHGWSATHEYFNYTVVYTEPLFVVVIMAIATTRPIVVLAESALRRVANLGRATPAAWWFTILTIGPLLGSFVTEPAAMTIASPLERCRTHREGATRSGARGAWSHSHPKHRLVGHRHQLYGVRPSEQESAGGLPARDAN